MTYITDLADLIRQQAPTSEIVEKINVYLDEKYIEKSAKRPTVQEWASTHADQIIQWMIMEHIYKIIEALLMVRSTDPTRQKLGNNRLLNYVTIYEDLRDKLGI